MAALCPVCPLCGRGTYEPRLSALLDIAALLLDISHDLKRGIEAVAFPQLETTSPKTEEQQP